MVTSAGAARRCGEHLVGRSDGRLARRQHRRRRIRLAVVRSQQLGRFRAVCRRRASAPVAPRPRCSPRSRIWPGCLAHVCNRTPERARALCDDSGPSRIPVDDIGVCAGADVVVNATSHRSRDDDVPVDVLDSARRRPSCSISSTGAARRVRSSRCASARPSRDRRVRRCSSEQARCVRALVRRAGSGRDVSGRPTATGMIWRAVRDDVSLIA